MIFHIDPLVYKLDHYNLQDTEGKYLVRDFVDIATNHGIGFSEYHWYLPGATKKLQKKNHPYQIYPRMGLDSSHRLLFRKPRRADAA